MFIPGHYIPPDCMLSDIGSISLSNQPASTLFRDVSVALHDETDTIAELCGGNVTGAVPPIKNGANCNVGTITHEIGTALLHGNTGGCAVVDDASLAGRNSGGDTSGDHGRLRASTSYVDPLPSSGPTAPLTHPGYTNHPTYGWLPSSNRYLALLAGRVAL